MASNVRITCLAAGHGDAILVEYGPADDVRRILVDGGPANCYEAVREAVLALPAAGRHFELLVVTHIDTDHIDGILILLQEETGATFDDVWFNGWPQLERLDASPRDDVFAPEQGEFLGAVLTEAELPWNEAFDHGPVVVPDSGELPTRDLAGGARIVLLSPGPQQLRRLRRKWRKTLEDAGQTPGDWAAARERLAARTEYRPALPREDVLAAAVPGSDSSVANGASIAFVLEYRGVSILLGADAHAKVLTASLKRLAAERSGPCAPLDAVALDAVKLAHHGSVKNVTAALLAAMRSSTFLVSTNGAHFGHPSPETLAMLAERFPSAEVRSNYRSDSIARWVEEAGDRASLRVVYPPDGGRLLLDTT